MIVRLCIVVIIFGIVLIFVAGSNAKFRHATIRLPDGRITSGTVTNFRTYKHNDNVEVTICGTTYFTHSSNVTLTT